jgi:hypothetical protein
MELRAQWFGGVQSRAADMAKNVPLPTSVSAAYRHIRDDPARQPDNNVGWLAATGMEPGLVFHCRCEVWIPSNFHGDAVAMQCAELMQETHSFADLKRRDQWQTVGIVGSVMTGGKANLVLRQSGIAGDVIFSCQWRVGLGPF